MLGNKHPFLVSGLTAYFGQPLHVLAIQYLFFYEIK